MGVMEYSYNYQKPESTYTLDQFIACQSDTNFCYNNTVAKELVLWKILKLKQ